MEPFLAEVRIVAFNFPPRGWAFCDGQLLAIGQSTALFSLLGTTYGGDGRTSFGLPNLKGRVVMHPGRGPGLADRQLGEVGGSETATIGVKEMPTHGHALRAFNDVGEDRIPSPTEALARSTGGNLYAAPAKIVQMAPGAVSADGGGQPHNNLQPYLTLNFCIALVGAYPARP